MKIFSAVLLVLLIALQAKLWVGSGSVADIWRLHQAVETQQAENLALLERNRALEAEVKDLQLGSDAVEERARAELGMIKKDETFFHVVHE